MSRTVTINACRTLDISLSYTPTIAEWTLTARYTVGYRDLTGVITDYAGLTQSGTVKLAIAGTQGPDAIASLLFSQILTAEGLSQADGDHIVDGAGTVLY